MPVAGRLNAQDALLPALIFSHSSHYNQLLWEQPVASTGSGFGPVQGCIEQRNPLGFALVFAIFQPPQTLVYDAGRDVNEHSQMADFSSLAMDAVALLAPLDLPDPGYPVVWNAAP